MITMDNNPWKIDCIEAFLFFNCPECAFIAKEENFFQDHAKDNHPQSYVLFGGKIEKSEDYKITSIGNYLPEDIEDNLSNDDQDQSQIENIEDFTGKYEELQLSDNDPLAMGKVIKFSSNNDLLKLEQTSAEDKIDNLEWNAGDTPVYKEEQKLQKIHHGDLHIGKSNTKSSPLCFSELWTKIPSLKSKTFVVRCSSLFLATPFLFFTFLNF